MKLGIVGAGRIGAMHADVLGEHPEVTDLVINDVDVARASKVAEGVDGRVAPTAHDLLASELDGLLIAAATAAHTELVKAGSDAGIPVFCEKPVAMDVEETQDVLDYVTARGTPVQVGFQRRFDDGYLAARVALRDGKIGELRRVHLLSADPAPPQGAYIATSGGIYRDLHIHDLDILRWVTNLEVVEVYATGSNRGASFFAEADDVDECVTTLVLEDGTLVTMQGSRYNGAGYDIRMELAGTEGTVAVGLSDRSPLVSAEPGESFPAGPPWVLFSDRFRIGYANQLHAFIDLVAGRCESPCTVTDALKAFHLAEAADRSLHERRVVRVEEVETGAETAL
jgi:myo-inositol 2-dehydrogenase/D-chiro-inositol 1-dehydrogenase